MKNLFKCNNVQYLYRSSWLKYLHNVVKVVGSPGLSKIGFEFDDQVTKMADIATNVVVKHVYCSDTTPVTLSPTLTTFIR